MAGDRHRRLRLACITGTLAALGVAGCTPAAAPAPTSTPPSPTLQAATALVNKINATAGGPIAAQQKAIVAAVDPAQREAQRRCGKATTTIRLEPVYPDLRREDWDSAATVHGTRYVLPTLVRVYGGSRIIGTDIIALKLTIDGRTAALAALCIT